MMSITFLVCFCSLICCYNKQIGGAVYIWSGSGKFTRVYFKDNKATGSVSNLLLSFSATSTINLSIEFFVHLFLSWKCFLTFILYIQPLCFFLCLSLIYEQGGGAVRIGSSGSGTFISCSWNGNSAPSVSNMFQIFFLLQQFH